MIGLSKIAFSKSASLRNQTITFDAISNKTYGDEPFSVFASATSGLPVIFSIVSGPATVFGSTVTVTGAGTVVVRASQAGGSGWNPAPNVDNSFVVAKAEQAIVFSAFPDKTYGYSPFEISGFAYATSGLLVTFSVASGPGTLLGTMLTITGAGSIVVSANQAGNDNYNAAPQQQQTCAVAKADQTIIFGAPDNHIYGDAPFDISGYASASSGLPVSFAWMSGPGSVLGSIVTITGAGIIVVRATQGGNANYNAATYQDANCLVNKADQTITFGALSDKTFGDPPFNPAASSSSGLTVSFSIYSGPATCDGTTVTLTGVGYVIVRADQIGDDNYNAAPYVDQGFNVASGVLSGGAWVVGSDVYGQLGDWSLMSKVSIVAQAGGITDWSAICSYDSHSHGLRAGTLWSWGDNAHHALGIGVVTATSFPIQVGAETDWSSVCTGLNHSLGIRAGKLFAWGYNAYGQLGLGDRTERNSPVQVGGETDWTCVSAGDAFTLGIRDGKLFGWGHNDACQITGAAITDRSSPTQIGAETDWSLVACGNNVSLGVRSGTLWSWGCRGYRLGYPGSVYYDVSSPTQVGSATDWSKVVAGTESCFGLRSGHLTAWGAQTFTQLGNGDHVALPQVYPIYIGVETDWIDIANNALSTYGIRGSGGKGTLWSWGRNTIYELGLNDTVQRSSPCQVGSDTDWIVAATGYYAPDTVTSFIGVRKV